MEEEAAREEKKKCSRPRTAAASPQPRRDDNKTTTNLPSRALGASRAKRRTYKSMPPPLAGCRPGEPEKSTHMHRRGDGSPGTRATLKGDNHAKSASARVLRGRSAGSPRCEARAGRAPRDSNAVITTFRSRSRRPGAVSVKKSLGQRRGVERATRWPRRQPRQVRQRARAPWAVGRFSTGRSARGPRGTGFRSFGHEVSKPQPPTWRGVGEEEPRPTAWGGARPALAAKTTTPSPPARACSVGGRPVSTGRSARGPRGTGFERFGYEVSKPQPPTWRGVGEEEPRPTAWGGARPALAAKTTTPSPPAARVLRGRLAGSPRGEARAGRAARTSNAVTTTIRSRSRRPGAVSVKKSLGQRRGVERAPRWPRRQPRQVRQRARAPWAVGRFSTGRSARGPRGTGFERCDYNVSKPQPPTRRGVSEEEPQPTAWGGARRALAAKTTTPSPPARACSVGSRLVLHGAKRARAHGTGFEAAATMLRSRSRRPGAVSVKKSLGQRRGVERAPRWPRRQPRQVRQRARAPWAVGWFSTGRSARGPHGTGFKRCGHDASKPQPPTWRGVSEERASANGVGWSVPRVGCEDNHAKSASARAPCKVGRLSTARSARGPHGTGFERYG